YALTPLPPACNTMAWFYAAPWPTFAPPLTIVLAALIATGVAGLAGVLALPLFIALKLLVLAFCIFIGLLVRRQLVPLIPAIVDLAKNGASPEGDKTIAGVLAVTQPTVMTLWAAVLIASFLGIATPL
ncbi:MAG: hypothetical protein VYD90_06620, partial [Pseudomonadota bacterium]|nr:hypothetical protein [Pseudomonadota bacterium]